MVEAEKQTRRIITANRLDDGRVVYLASGGGWTAAQSTALVISDEAVEAALIEEAQAGNEFVDVYGLDVQGTDITSSNDQSAPDQMDDGARRPVSTRERIRGKGPSVRADLGYQANNG